MVMRRINVRTTPALRAANAGNGLLSANSLTPVQGISPSFTFQSAFPQSAFPQGAFPQGAFPRFHFHRFPFFGFRSPFFGFGNPFFGLGYYGYPFDPYDSGLYANPYVFATGNAYGSYGIANADAFAESAANP